LPVASSRSACSITTSYRVQPIISGGEVEGVILGVILLVGVIDGVLVGVGEGEGHSPNDNIAPSVPTWNTSPVVLLNQLFPPLYKLAGIKIVVVYNALPKDDAWENEVIPASLTYTVTGVHPPLHAEVLLPHPDPLSVHKVKALN
jgi:hypothetical protein